MKHNLLKVSALVLFFILIETGCKKEFIVPSNITLYDKPLSLIQSCINGKWRLQYSSGGLSYRKVIAKHNYYMVLSPDHITLGNDSLGVFVDAKVNWSLINSAYRFSYGSYYKTPIEIKNDTLVIIDYLDDGFRSCYTKY
jgi:hypothetical protein